MMLSLSLSLTPTAMIGLNDNFDMPTNYQVRCSAPPSVFAYPVAETKKEDEKKFIAKAVLSITAKAEAREARKEAKKQSGLSPKNSPSKNIPLSRTNSNMEISSNSSSPDKLGNTLPEESSGPALERVHSHMSATSYISMEEVGSKTKTNTRVDEKENPIEKKKEKEATSFLLNNPSRVTVAQVKYISTLSTTNNYDSDTTKSDNKADSDGTLSPVHYQPIKEMFSQSDGHNTAPVGIVMLLNTDPTKSEEVMQVEVIALGAGGVEEEATPPMDFEWDPNEDA